MVEARAYVDKQLSVIFLFQRKIMTAGFCQAGLPAFQPTPFAFYDGERS